MDPVLADFFQNTTSPAQDVIDFLVVRNCVPISALSFDSDGRPSVFGTASVSLDGKLFDFATPGIEDSAKALVFVARDRCGDPRDLVAWAPRGHRVASHYGRAALLGEHELDAPRLAGPLRVHRDVLSWLQAGRTGVVIIDRRRAWRALEGVTVAAEDLEHGLELRKALTAPAPRIVVPAPVERAAA